MSDCGCEFEANDEEEKRTLVVLLCINAVMFFIEFGAGILAYSAGLLADSIDMFADASIYGASLYAVGRSQFVKARVASIAGVFELLLGFGIVTEVFRRLIFGANPESDIIIGIGLLALSANVTCLMLLAKHRRGGVHMRASWIFSANDVVANMGVIMSGILVAYTGSRYPDLIVGFVVSAVVIWGGVRILREARKANRTSHAHS